MHRLGLVYYPAAGWSLEPDHPENDRRLRNSWRYLSDAGILDRPEVAAYESAAASPRAVLRAHICVPSLEEAASMPCLYAAGGAIAAADAVVSGGAQRACTLARPPGHHAMRFIHGWRGFCRLNNQAIMIEHLRARNPGLRVAVIDTDAHHADGTQDIYYNDPGVLHISVHQDGLTLYPGTGHTGELGGPGAYALTLNVPLPPGSGDGELLFVIERLVLPVLGEFAPDLVIHGIGFDGLSTDPLANLAMTAQGYARVSGLLRPDITVLEGGYTDGESLSEAVTAVVMSLIEPDMYRPGEIPAAASINPSVSRVVAGLLERWSRRDNPAPESVFGGEKVFRRHRRIYHDTSDIMEERIEEFHQCADCGGFQLMRSSTVRGKDKIRSAALIIPRGTCPRCQLAAKTVFGELEQFGQIDLLYLQDIEAERFERVECGVYMERNIH